MLLSLRRPTLTFMSESLSAHGAKDFIINPHTTKQQAVCVSAGVATDSSAFLIF